MAQSGSELNIASNPRNFLGLPKYCSVSNSFTLKDLNSSLGLQKQIIVNPAVSANTNS
jgi:hypothetical protein